MAARRRRRARAAGHRRRPARPKRARSCPPAGPATRRLARELGVDLDQVNGTGAAGRITEEDIKAAVRGGQTAARARRGPARLGRSAPLPAGTDDRDTWGPIRRTKMTSIRKTIAVNMAKSATTIPHVTNFDDADITELERIRKGGLADYVDSSIKLTMMPFVMKAIAQSLRLHPLLNASIDMEQRADHLQGIREHRRGGRHRARAGRAGDSQRRSDEHSGHRQGPGRRGRAGPRRPSSRSTRCAGRRSRSATWARSAARIRRRSSIRPNVAILLTGRSRKLPVVIDDKIEPRLMMPLSLSYDHRLVDGATAARFLNEVINYLKVPGRLLLSP